MALTPNPHQFSYKEIYPRTPASVKQVRWVQLRLMRLTGPSRNPNNPARSPQTVACGVLRRWS